MVDYRLHCKFSQSPPNLYVCTVLVSPLWSEPSRSVARVGENTKKIHSILCASIHRLFLGPLVKGRSFAKGRRKYAVGTCVKRVEGPPFFLRIFLLPPPSPAQRHVLHNYVLNSDEGLTERTLLPILSPSHPSTHQIRSRVSSLVLM
jgi:hypothetical protein